MQPLAIAQSGLDGVTEGVAVIQYGADAAFFFVLPHHPGLDFAAAAHRCGQRLWVAGQQRGQMGFDPVQKRHVCNGAVLDDFGQTRAQLALGQRFQCVQVSHHQLRLVERTDHVLAQRVVDGGFAAHAAVHLRQQRGGHLYKRHAAHVASGGKAGHVAHHAAAQGVKHGFAVSGAAQQLVVNQVEGGTVFVLLAIGQCQHSYFFV